ncbi:hypothetical protein ACWIUD_01825 [Helicobacter sp. 23-1044]
MKNLKNSPIPLRSGTKGGGGLDSTNRRILHKIPLCHIERSEISQKFVIARLACKSWQSTNATCESNANRLLFANLNATYLSIRFCIIYFHFLLNSLDLDGCFTSFAKQGKAEVSLSNPADCFDSANRRISQ